MKMNIYEYAVMESKIESAENRIRSIHNDLESQKLFGKKKTDNDTEEPKDDGHTENL